jgi:hypothetical protein
MPRLTRSRTAALGLTSGILLAGCSSHIMGSLSLHAPLRLGTSGHEFRASFPRPPTTRTYVDSGEEQAQYGVGVRTSTTYVSVGQSPFYVNVSVVLLTNVVPPRRVNPFLRSQLPTSHGGRIIKWFGQPAAQEFVPGCDPSGTCVGTIGSLVVLDGTTMYEIFTHQDNRPEAEQEIRTFRLVK